MPVIEVDSTDDPRLADYRDVRDADLLGRRGVFMAEGREVVRTLLTRSRFTARSVLVTPVAFEAMRDVLETASLPVYRLPQDQMNAVVGFDIHRGCLAVGERGELRTLRDFLSALPVSPSPARVVVLESLTNHDNVGGIFRNAAAFGAAGIILSPDCCDPLYRKSIRVSMGSVLHVPFVRTTTDEWPSTLFDSLRAASLHTLALTPRGETDLASFGRDIPVPLRAALFVGAEGPGLSQRTMSDVDTRVRITMSPGFDSLNASTATAIALHALTPLDTLTP